MNGLPELLGLVLVEALRQRRDQKAPGPRRPPLERPRMSEPTLSGVPEYQSIGAFGVSRQTCATIVHIPLCQTKLRKLSH